MRRKQVGLVVLVVLSVAGAAGAQGQGFSPELNAQVASLKSAAPPGLDSRLVQIVQQLGTLPEDLLASQAPVSQGITVAVTVRFAGGAGSLPAYLASMGASVATLSADAVEAYVPVSSLMAIAQRPGVTAVEPIVPPLPLVTSQGVAAHNANNWHPAGYLGTGVKVGIIDTGFMGYGALIGSELPTPAAVRCFSAIGVFSNVLSDCERIDNHGTGVAEAVVDVAPNVTVYLSNPQSSADLRTAVDWMAAQGVRVINHSVAWIWDGPGDGTSPFSTSPVNTVGVAAASGNGIVWVNAAGNHNLATWRGGYAESNGLLLFNGAAFNPVQLTAGQPIIVQARWEDGWPGANRDIDLFLVDIAQNQTVALSINNQAGGPGDIPREVISYTPTTSGTFHVILARGTPGSNPSWVQVQAFTEQALGTISNSHGIANPAESASNVMLATGAVRWSTTSVIESFSSRGPTTDNRTKPDLVGADGGDSVTFGSGGFLGTTQSAAHVTGLAAMVMTRFPTLSGPEVATYLKTNVLPRSPANTFGSGFAFLPSLLDSDSDLLPDFWELQFGLDPNSALGGNGKDGDPDGDGLTNLQELQQGSHPKNVAALNRYFAEGATSTFFDASFALVNPSTTTPANVLLRFQTDAGATTNQYVAVPALGRRTVTAKNVTGLLSAAFSTLVETDQLVVADRTMTWDASGYGSHAETAVLAPANDWYLAEGATHSGFDLFYLIQNPNATAATVTVTYLLPPPAASFQKVYSVPASSRFNIWVDNEASTFPVLAATDVSARLQSNVPIIVERAMYLNSGGQAFGAGHDSAGVTAPALSWFLAEGATGNFFDLFILVANPNPTAAQIAVRFLLTTGQVITRNYTVDPNSRFNIWVDTVDPALVDAAVSTTVTVTNGVPVIVERAMWWPGPTAATWAEAHNSPGVPQTGTKWALAEGEQGGSRNLQTYILVANTSAFDATVKTTLLFEDGTTSEQTFTVSATSRFNVDIGAFFTAAGKRFGAIVESTNGAAIVVERAMYSDANGVTWAAGTNAVATRLQ